MAVQSDPAAGRHEEFDPARRGHEIALGVLGIDPAFDRGAGDSMSDWEKASFSWKRSDLLLDQVDPRDELRDRVPTWILAFTSMK